MSTLSGNYVKHYGVGRKGGGKCFKEMEDINSNSLLQNLRYFLQISSHSEYISIYYALRFSTYIPCLQLSKDTDPPIHIFRT